MLDETKDIVVSDQSVLNLPDNLENSGKEEDNLLSLIAEIIVEIIISKKDERYRIH